MIKEFLQSIPGVSAYPVFSLLLFFGLFAAVVVWAFFRLDKSYVTKMENLPLDSSNSSTLSGE